MAKNIKVPSSSLGEGATLKRDLHGKSKLIVYGVSILLALAQIYLIIFALTSPMVHVSIFLMFIVLLVFLYYKPVRKASSRCIPWYDWVGGVFFSLPYLYAAIYYNDIIDRAIRPTVLDQIMTVIAILAILEISRRTIGIILPIISLVFIVYTMWGNNLPGILEHRGYNFERLTNTMFMTTNGIFGSPTQVAATMVFMFVLFGSFLNATGASRVITDGAFSIAGKYIGGPAKVSVLASGMMGMVSGSASSNVATTGQITIPLMKKVGYKPNFAAAVESAASTAGTITPPIMGAAAFIMAEITGIPYAEIVIAGIIPALLFYVAIFLSVHFEAGRLGLTGIPKNDLPNILEVFRKGISILLPLVLLIVLIMMNYPIMYAAFYSTIALTIIAILHPGIRMGVKKIFRSIADSGEMVLQAATACACAGLVIGTLNLTGLGLRFSSFTLGLAGESILLALIFTMVITIILGMGLPPVAAYIIAASVAAPALTEIGFSLLASHMFVFYFSALSSITPPVAVTSFIGAGIARANPMITAFISCYLALPAFIVPYLFLYSGEYLMVGSALSIIFSVITALFGFTFISAGIIGYLKKPMLTIERLLLTIGGTLIIFFSDLFFILGIVIIIITITFHWKRRVRTQKINKQVL